MQRQQQALEEALATAAAADAAASGTPGLYGRAEGEGEADEVRWHAPASCTDAFEARTALTAPTPLRRAPPPRSHAAHRATPTLTRSCHASTLCIHVMHPRYASTFVPCIHAPSAGRRAPP
jgi:hypothetical protein